jgi:hypothetical protein
VQTYSGKVSIFVLGEEFSERFDVNVFAIVRNRGWQATATVEYAWVIASLTKNSRTKLALNEALGAEERRILEVEIHKCDGSCIYIVSAYITILTLEI